LSVSAMSSPVIPSFILSHSPTPPFSLLPVYLLLGLTSYLSQSFYLQSVSPNTASEFPGGIIDSDTKTIDSRLPDRRSLHPPATTSTVSTAARSLTTASAPVLRSLPHPPSPRASSRTSQNTDLEPPDEADPVHPAALECSSTPF
jgi:hypothetical protein